MNGMAKARFNFRFRQTKQTILRGLQLLRTAEARLLLSIGSWPRLGGDRRWRALAAWVCLAVSAGLLFSVGWYWQRAAAPPPPPDIFFPWQEAAPADPRPDSAPLWLLSAAALLAAICFARFLESKNWPWRPLWYAGLLVGGAALWMRELSGLAAVLLGGVSLLGIYSGGQLYRAAKEASDRQLWRNRPLKRLSKKPPS